ncbi:hypothetical protein EDF60_1663 [Leucobacter luti]|uniref:hypothetical protein n=1 Tax=Leucobacter luti TaxID=340320 RepID=UPI00104A6890|nr:hypothetical protein [Leucobacter luti]MCW2287012.1 hypothetical protein [Leucobacter luti]TCK41237.1 hypothetical protein EDF60_1663 [Leucobacter luti]
MTLEEMEATADANTAKLLELIEAGQRSNLATWMDGRDRTELAWMVLALGNGLLQHEREADRLVLQNAILTRQNETLEVANKQLFAERTDLIGRVKELRVMVDQKTAASTAKREKRSA